jgi:hypothetical protein
MIFALRFIFIVQNIVKQWWKSQQPGLTINKSQLPGISKCSDFVNDKCDLSVVNSKCWVCYGITYRIFWLLFWLCLVSTFSYYTS